MFTAYLYCRTHSDFFHSSHLLTNIVSICKNSSSFSLYSQSRLVMTDPCKDMVHLMKTFVTIVSISLTVYA
uniref:Secreted protein n=1 Tax=Ascaris lumbricoides TaxID=6252 RepID=A0A0M3IM57_ASCLU